MLATVENTYTWLPVLIMLVAGSLGGAINNFLATDSASDGSKLDLKRSVVIGVGAALLVPLFLNMISSNLLSEVVGGKDNPGDFGKALVFLGFCLVAAISSRAFIQTISDRLLNEVKKTANEAKIEAEDAQTKVGEVVNIVAEPEEQPTLGVRSNATMLEPSLGTKERNLLNALAEGKWMLRSRTGVVNDAKISPEEIDSLLRKLEDQQLIGQTKSSSGPRWYITQAGRDAIGSIPGNPNP